MHAIVTIAIGKTYRRIADMTHPSIKAYADRIGADFVVLDSEKLSSVSPHYEKFQLYYLLNKYSRIIFLDTDIIVREDCPNLFEIVPEHMMGLVNEGLYQDRSQQMRETCELYEGDFESYDLKRYYNTGVMVVSRAHKDLFVMPEKETIWNFYEQSYLNLCIQEMRIRVKELDYKFNRVGIMDRAYGEHRLASYIVHYAGVLSGLESLIPSDLTRWRNGDHKRMRRQVAVGVGARLGDNICAEPAIRYMINRSTNTDFTIFALHPDLFSHLDAKILPFDQQRHGMYGSENPCVMFNTAMDEKDPKKELLSPDYMHIVDYISLLCMNRQLADKDKQIKLPVSAKGLAQVLDVCGKPQDMILVHPGKSWPSKTFPVEYWNSIIGYISKEGYKVGVIGRHVSKDVGVLDVDIPDGCYDFMDLLDINGLIAAISQAPVLVSNDSAPIHIAGAFDNHLVLIPTCKHPDMILPYRFGSKSYKCTVLFKKLMCDEAGFDQSNLSNYEMSQVDDIWKYLPDPKEVADNAIKAFNHARR